MHLARLDARSVRSQMACADPDPDRDIAVERDGVPVADLEAVIALSLRSACHSRRST